MLTELGGKVNFKDIVEGENVREETDKVTGLTQMVIVESSTTEKRTPTLIIKAGKGETQRTSCRVHDILAQVRCALPEAQ